MRLTRCYVELDLCPDVTVLLPETTSNHLLRVLRLREGDPCILFNGDGHDYPARILSTGKRQAQVHVESAQIIDNESPLRITLVQGIARGEKMDLILQKATELGASEIVPITAERTEVRLDAARTEKRMSHWHSVIASACEQSGRARIPQLRSPVAVTEAASAIPTATTRLTLDPQGEHGLSTLQLTADRAIAIAIGPEGGWSPRDIQTLAQAGFSGLRLGPRVLRTETAGLAAIAALQARFGDL